MVRRHREARIRRRVLTMVAVITAACWQASAAGSPTAPRSAPVVSPTTIHLAGLTDGKTPVSFTTLVDVGSNEKIEGLVLDATPLAGPGGLTMDRNCVRLSAGAVNLVADTYVPVAIVIEGLVRPGRYEGSFTLRAPTSRDGATVTLSIDLAGKPALELGTESLASFGCRVPWSCAIGRFFWAGRRVVSIDNRKGAGAAKIARASLVLRANRTGSVLDENDATLQVPSSIEPGRGGAILVNVPSALAADRYQGFLSLTVPDLGEPVTSNVTLDVRHGPLVAIVVLGFAIWFGRRLQALNSPAALARQRLLATLAALRASDVQDRGMREVVSRKIAAARRQIAAMIQTEADLSRELVNISTAIALARELDWLKAEHAALPNPIKEVADHLALARDAFLGEGFEAAEKERALAQKALLARQGLRAPSDTVEDPTFTFLESPAAASRPWSLSALQWVAGTEAVGREDTGSGALARAGIFAALVAGLVLFGLYTLYVKNATFGADPLGDYFGLFAWGLSTDVAQRTLQNLQLGK